MCVCVHGGSQCERIFGGGEMGDWKERHVQQTKPMRHPFVHKPLLTCLLLNHPPPVVHVMIGRHRPHLANIRSPPPLLLPLPLLLSYWWWWWLGPEFTAAFFCRTCMRMKIEGKGGVMIDRPSIEERPSTRPITSYSIRTNPPHPKRSNEGRHSKQHDQ